MAIESPGAKSYFCFADTYMFYFLKTIMEKEFLGSLQDLNLPFCHPTNLQLNKNVKMSILHLT